MSKIIASKCQQNKIIVFFLCNYFAFCNFMQTPENYTLREKIKIGTCNKRELRGIHRFFFVHSFHFLYFSTKFVYTHKFHAHKNTHTRLHSTMGNGIQKKMFITQSTKKITHHFCYVILTIYLE